MYRQFTLNAIGGRAQGDDRSASRQAYQDVLDAFKQYLADDSDGRGFVLIGHSQGSIILGRLIANEIDAQPARRDRLVSAILPGANLTVPRGEVVGGSFQNVPLCEADVQSGCHVVYSTFRATAPPQPNSLFARNRQPDEEDACVNPAALDGGKSTLEPYFSVARSGAGRGAVRRRQPHGRDLDPVVHRTGRRRSRVRPRRRRHVPVPDRRRRPGRPRGDDIGGDLSPEWGMHLIDVNVALGNLVDLVGPQGEAYAAG
jgi:alpha-beta hydrolase superfamily lysophospholipase